MQQAQRNTRENEKAVFERLYLVSGQLHFVPFVTMPSAPIPPPLTEQLFLDFVQFESPLNFLSARFTK